MVSEIVDRDFMANRARVLEIAAFLDRVDRDAAAGGAGATDYRVAALRRAIRVLVDQESARVRRIQELLSDQTDAPVERAGGQGAFGAVRPDA